MRHFFSKLWAGWKELAKYFADFQSRWLLTVFYFTIILPFGLLATLFMDGLHTKRVPENSAWMKREDHSAGIESANHMY